MLTFRKGMEHPEIVLSWVLGMSHRMLGNSICKLIPGVATVSPDFFYASTVSQPSPLSPADLGQAAIRFACSSGLGNSFAQLKVRSDAYTLRKKASDGQVLRTGQCR